ncbi:MAG TPA: hypothetical protein VNA25_11705 [Phycisphaerae bacterium]|nr:hypothetical protein [Phycisphaerae bacterium]
MAQALYEDITRRSRQPASGQDWTGYKHIRVFRGLPDGDMAYHRANELSPGAVLPTKWGGVSTSRAIDPRLTYAPEAGQSKAAATQIYTEWTEITTISGWSEDFWTPYESRVSGGRTGSLEQFQGERTAIILASEVGPLAPYYNVAMGADHPFPGSSGPLGAHLRAYTLFPMAERPLCARLRLLYGDRTPIQALEPGRAILTVQVAGKAVKQVKDNDGKVIDGPDETDGNVKWVIVKGSNVTLEPGALVRITTASDGANVPMMWDAIGTLNSNTFSHIGNAPAQTMRFRGASVSGALINRKYWGLSYEFEYQPLDADGNTRFGGGIESQKMTKYPKTVQVMKDTPPVPDGTKTTTVVSWWPTDAPVARTLKPGLTDFSEFDGMLGWY